jgi:aminoglycoside phosphotransferase
VIQTARGLARLQSAAQRLSFLRPQPVRSRDVVRAMTRQTQGLSESKKVPGNRLSRDQVSRAEDRPKTNSGAPGRKATMGGERTMQSCCRGDRAS